MLGRKELFAKTVVLKLRYDDFRTITRSQSRQPATCSADEIATRAAALLDKTEAGRKPVRLLGVSVHGLGASSDTPASSPLDQLDLPVK